MDKMRFNLVYCTWDKIDEEIRSFFISLYGGDTESAKRMYESYFMRYNLIHEVAHTLQSQYGVQEDLYESEQGANDIAVAYWRERQPKVIEEINDIVNHMLEILKSPVTKGEDEKKFFVQNYEKLGLDPAAYGYYQFKLVKNSLEKEWSFYQSLKNCISDRTLECGFEEEKSEDFKVGEVDSIIEGFTEYLKRYGLNTPTITTFNQFMPALQFVSREL